MAHSTELVNATDLDRWAGETDARHTLPELVRLLVQASGVATSVSFRSGEGTDLSGWDGQVTAQSGDAYVPEGSSGWELGAGGDIAGKASKDYRDRTRAPLGIVRPNSTFLFVTPRRWPGRDHWVRKRRRRGEWRDVRAYDADDLYGWLQAHRAVHVWISERLGRDPGSAVTLEAWWDDWSTATRPPLPAELVLAGRAGSVESLRERLEGPPLGLAVRTEGIDESIAFVAAALRDTVHLERALLVSSRVAWDRAASSQSPLVLLPTFEGAPAVTAVRAGHHVVVPQGAGASGGADVEPPRVSRLAAREALEAAGVTVRADELAAQARRSLRALRRGLAAAPALSRPWWAEHPTAGALAPLVLAGAWVDERDGDRAVVAELCGRDYPAVERDLHGWAAREDAPVRRSGATWRLAGKEDAWRHLAPALTGADYERYGHAVRKVLSEVDPALDLDPGQRFMASVLGHDRRWSGTLREALADTAAMLGTLGTEGGDTTSRLLVRDLLAAANQDESGGTWHSLADALPLLAEAAPAEFLDAVEAGLPGEAPILRHVFADAGDSDPLTSSSPHTHLLWALETLCWAPEHLGRAVMALARLAALDPGGRLVNRPLDSLRRVLLPLQPHTAATPEERLAAVERVFDAEPAVGWRLLLTLLPQHPTFWLPTATPRWRDWVPEAFGTHRPPPDLLATSERLAEMALERAGRDGRRLGEFASLLTRLDPIPCDALLTALDRLDASAVAGPDELWDAISEVVDKCRAFPDADWALPPDRVDELQAVADRLQVASPVPDAARWFRHMPPMRRAARRDFAEFDAEVRTRRVEAAHAVLTAEGVEGLRRLWERAESAWNVGWAIADLDSSEAEASVFESVGASGQAGEAARGFVTAVFRTRGWDWVRGLLEGPAETWSLDRRVSLLLALPVADARTVAVAGELGEAGRERYVSMVSPYAIPLDAVPDVVPSLLDAGRPWAAITALAQAERRSPTGAERELIHRALRQAVDGPVEDRPTSASPAHELGILLDTLAADGDEAFLASMEWAFFPLLEHQRGTPALDRALAAEPDLFAEVVCLVYRAAGEPDDDTLSEEEQARARHAYAVLHSWSRLPGLRDDGSVDGAALERWVAETNRLLEERGRSEVASMMIGRVLAASPDGSDGFWPAEPVRDVLERLADLEVEESMAVGRFNQRGVTVRPPEGGGQQERSLAEHYRDWAARVREGGWYRTERVLAGLADDYERHARREDAMAEVWEDRG